MLRKTFEFSNNSTLEMLEAVKRCTDNEEFKFDCCAIDWDDYIKKSVLGSQKYILKCDEKELPSARRALKVYVPVKISMYFSRRY